MNNRKELALYIINLKIANSIKNNQEKDFNKFKENMQILYDEKNEIYNNNEQIIEKVLTVYLEEVKNK
ncbi:MAG: hypothetical protein IKF83_00525 [Clostridia bacterium]|nr:hypothetical protein [Clostridia bacterium]